MKDKDCTKKQFRSFNAFRAIAIAALICTVALAVFILEQALVPGDKSALQSGNVTNTIKNTIDVNDNDAFVQLVSIDITNKAKTGKPIGTQKQINVNYTPKSATDKGIIYSSSDESVCSVNADGVVTYLSYGYATITATSQKHQEISDKIELFCNGENPDSVSSLRLNFSTENDVPLYELSAGARKRPVFRDENGNIVSFSALSTTSDNSDVLTVDDYGYFLALREGETNITVKHKKSGYTETFLFTVTANPEFVLPTAFTFENDTVYINIGERLYPTDNVVFSLPEGSSADSEMYYVESATDSVLTQRKNYFLASALGETTIYLFPYANPDSPSSFKVIVQEPIPTYINIEGKDRIVAGDRYEYAAFFDKEYLQSVRWEIASGSATISESGILVANKLGNVTVRVTSTTNPDVYSELTVRVSLFSNFHLFVRKIIGHFSAFAVLGFGFACVYFLLLRPRGLYALFAALSGFGTALLSEVFQLPVFVSGRGASWIDVMIDTCGALCGIAIASAIIWIYLLLTKCLSKTNFERVRRSLSLLNGKTLLISVKRSRALCDMQEYSPSLNTKNPFQSTPKTE